MTTRTHKLSLQSRARILAALGAASLALIAASPADAINRAYEPGDGEAPVVERAVEQAKPPVDENGKRSCYAAIQHGGGFYVRHGGTITVTIPADPTNGIPARTVTYKCNDGNWEAAAPDPGAYHHYWEADEAIVNGGGTLELADPHQQYANAFYAEP